MSGTFLLDTNAAIALIEKQPGIEALLNDAELVLSTIVLGELYYGAERSARVSANMHDVELLSSKATLLGCDSITARHYGRIFQQLRSRGRPIPQNDVWIAATAMQHDLTLLTRDAHFEHVDGLALHSF